MKQEQYTVAVLLSAYNGEKYIIEQVNSILAQNNSSRIKLIIRDDGSKDNTIGILTKHYESNPQIEILRGENIGYVRSFFYLLEYAYRNQYDYYAFADQDDYWFPEKLETGIKMIENETGPALYSGRSELADEKMTATGRKTRACSRDITYNNTAIQNICPGHNIIINKPFSDIICNIKMDYEKIFAHDLWLAAAASVIGTIKFDGVPHVLYRQHEKNSMKFGDSLLGYLRSHINRLKNLECRKTALQYHHATETFSSYLNEAQKLEAEAFFRSQRSLRTRVLYATKTKLYRQSNGETIIFKILYIFGFYNIENVSSRNEEFKINLNEA